MKFKLKIIKKETEENIGKRILRLSENNTKSKEESFNAVSIDAQTALNDLIEHFLGKDWYVVDPLTQGQVNAIALLEIESRNKKYRDKEI